MFFAFVIDVFSRRVVGWQLARHMRSSLVTDALRMALARRSAGADVQLGQGRLFTGFQPSQPHGHGIAR